MMKRSRGWRSLLALLLLALTPVAAQAASVEEKRADIRSMAQQALGDLYAKSPGAKSVVEHAAGYGVFSNFGLKILVLGSGKGSGVVMDTSTKKETFMDMVELQAGLGFGAKKFRQVWVFKTKAALDQFINSGWELGGQSTAAAQHDDKGASAAGAIAVNPDIWLYQMTDEGLALELTAKGTKYYKDKKLN
jgi:lipid-binding SYLF domain-containing protein